MTNSRPKDRQPPRKRKSTREPYLTQKPRIPTEEEIRKHIDDLFARAKIQEEASSLSPGRGRIRSDRGEELAVRRVKELLHQVKEHNLDPHSREFVELRVKAAELLAQVNEWRRSNGKNPYRMEEFFD